MLDGDGIALHRVDDVGDVVALCDGAAAIAIDAPSDPATGRVHTGSRSPKFAVARCCEIAAGEQLGVWVPWVTPVRDACPPWMLTGFAVWHGLRGAGHAPVEVYPAGCFWLVNGRRWPPRKTTPEGRAARAAMLGVSPALTHDAIDAVMAARVGRGPSLSAGHDEPGCDGSRLFVLADASASMGGVGDDADLDLAAQGAALADAVAAAIPGWVVRAVESVAGPSLAAEAAVAGRAAAADVGPNLRALLATDVDFQRVNPLTLVRDAVSYPTVVLRRAGVPPRPRSRFDEEHFPGDDYGLVPMTWRDVDESLHEPGLVWGALKARAYVRRHGHPPGDAR